MPIRISHLDHLVLTVRDIDATCRFYDRVLGMKRLDFGEGRVALRFGEQKINLHPADAIPDAHVKHPLPGSDDLCFITTTPIEEVVRHLESENVTIHSGPGERAGARSRLISVYFYDPDENQIEVSNELEAGSR